MQDYRAKSYKKIADDKAKSKGFITPTSKTSNRIASSSSGGSGSKNSSSSQVVDYRAESYAQIATDTRNSPDSTINQYDLKISPDSVVTSESSKQVAIRGDATLIATEKPKPVIESTTPNENKSELPKLFVDYAEQINKPIENKQSYFQVEPPKYGYAPTQRSFQETQPINNFKDSSSLVPLPKYGGEIGIYNPSLVNMPLSQKAYSAFELSYTNFKLKTQRPGNELLLLPAVGVTLGYGFVSEGIGTGKGIYKAWRERPKSIAQVPMYTFTLGSGIISGFSEQIGGTVSAASSGDVNKLSEYGGRFAYQSSFGAGVTKGVKTTLKGAFVDFGKEVKFIEATELSPKDVNYNFRNNIIQYDISGRKGVIVPDEYRGALNVKSSPELQTQLYPKSLTQQIDNRGSLFGSPEYKPRTFIEVSRDNPILARELALDNGQTLLTSKNRNRPGLSSLSNTALLEVTRQNLNLKSTQTKLTGFEEFVNKNPVKTTTLVAGKTKFVRVEQNSNSYKNFAFPDPVSATAYTIYTQRGNILRGSKDYYSKYVREPIKDLGTGFKEGNIKFKGFIPLQVNDIGTIQNPKREQVYKPFTPPTPGINIKPVFDYKPSQDIFPSSKLNPKQSSGIKPIQGTKQTTSQIQIPLLITTTTPFTPKNPKTPGFKWPIPETPKTPTPRIPGGFDLSLGGGSGYSVRRFGGSRRTRYAPSFNALFYKIRGAYKKGKLSKSGLDFRPITSGYSITGGKYDTVKFGSVTF